MKKTHRTITVSFGDTNSLKLMSRLCELLDEGWKLERVDSPSTANLDGVLVYLLSKEE